MLGDKSVRDFFIGCYQVAVDARLLLMLIWSNVSALLEVNSGPVLILHVLVRERLMPSRRMTRHTLSLEIPNSDARSLPSHLT